LATTNSQQTITSPQNAKVGLLRSLHTTKGRDQEHAWLLEGPHLLQEALHARLKPRLILYDPEAMAQSPLLKEFPTLLEEGVEIATTTALIMSRVGETQTPQGIVAAMDLDMVKPERLRQQRGAHLRPITLILDDLRDPGNVGTILRSALAADVEAAYLTPQCADVYAPKVIRSGSGAHFHLPIYADQNWHLIARHFGTIPVQQVVIADSSATDDFTDLDLTIPTALIIGNEAHGPSISARRNATRTVRIPMYNGVESLNAAIAASIILFESARQRRAKRGQA